MESSEDSEHAKIQSLLEKIWWTIMYCEIKNYNCKNSNKIISKRSKVHAHLATCNKLSVIVKTKPRAGNSEDMLPRIGRWNLVNKNFFRTCSVKRLSRGGQLISLHGVMFGVLSENFEGLHPEKPSYQLLSDWISRECSSRYCGG